MRFPIIIFILANWIILFCTNKTSFAESLATNQVRVAYTENQSLYIIDSDGNDIFHINSKLSTKPDWEGQEKFEYGFLVADVHPFLNKAVSACCHDYDPSEGPLRGFCELVEILFDQKTDMRILKTFPPENILDAPVWSNDGHQIAFLLGEKRSRNAKLIILNETGEIEQEYPLNNLGGINPNGSYLEWSSDNERIYIWTTRRLRAEKTTTESDKDVGILTVKTGDVRWLGEWEETQTIDKNKFGKWNQGTINVEDVTAIKTLFGSTSSTIPETRTNRLNASSNNQYIFYTKQQIGTPSEKWVERYDTATNKKQKIKTIWWIPLGFE